MAVTAVLSIVTAVHYATFGDLLARLTAGTADLPDAQAFDATTNALALLGLVVLGATAIAFFAWQSRAVDNLAALGLGPGLVTPRWSIGWWFVPIANLQMVPRIMLDLGQRLDVARLSWFQVGVVTWWLTWISSTTLILVAAVPVDATADDLQRSALVHETTSLMQLLAASVLISLIRAMQGAAERRAAALQAEGAGAQAPSA